MGVRRSYTVTVRAAETIAPAETMVEHRLPMSNLDLLLPPMDVGVFFCYEKTMMSLEAMVAVLSVSLAQALSTYYPFAGEVVANSLGEPEVLCNGRGVDFAAAYADVELRELALDDPDDSVEGKLMPKKKAGVFCVQATGLKGGGLVLACKFDHRVADAYSANMFLVFWSELAAFGHATCLPSFSRTLLSPRLPLRRLQYPSIDRLFVPVSSLPPQPICPPLPADVAVNRIYYITNADVASLQSSTRGRTKVEAFTAYLWRALAKAAGAEGLRWCRMGAVVDGRTRLSAAMGNYFGNVLSIPFGRMEAAELRGMALAEVAERVRGWLRPAATEDHFRVLVDWVEAHRPDPAVARIYTSEAEAEGDLACVVSSGRGFPVKEVEFGWGKPAFGSYHFPWGGTAGYVMPMPSARGNGDWVVYAHLRKSVVAVLEAEQPPVFRQLTPDYYLADIN